MYWACSDIVQIVKSVLQMAQYSVDMFVKSSQMVTIEITRIVPLVWHIVTYASSGLIPYSLSTPTDSGL